MMATGKLFELNTGARAAGTLNEELYARELRQCAEAGGDEEALRAAGFNVNQLEQIRQGLEAGLDVAVYAKPKYSWMDMEEIRKGLEDGIDMTRYREEGFSTEQKREIRKGIQSGLDVSQYDTKQYISAQMHEIRLGMESELPIILYKDPSFEAAQMKEIRKGLLSNIDISVYAKPEIPYLKMRAIRKGLECGVNFREQDIKLLDAGILDQLQKAHREGIDIRKYVDEGYNSPQLEQIRISLEEGLKFESYIRKDMRGESLKEIRLGIEANVEVRHYAKTEYTWRQMRQIRIGLENRVDVSFYSNPLFQSDQMREIRLGLQQGLDVTRYNSLIYTASDMREIRLAMEKGEDSGHKPDPSSYIPDQYEDPIVPLSERPNTKTLRLLIAKEAAALKARKEGKTQDTAVPHLPDAGDIPIGLFGPSEEEDGLSSGESKYPPIKGYLLSISQDRMACTLSLPEPPEGVKYLRDQVVGLLAKSGVKYGIDIQAIDSIIHKGRYNEQVTVATGKPPVPGKDGRYEYFFDRGSLSNPKFTDDGSADFSDVRFFSEVRAGQELVKYHKGEKGTDGLTVTGETAPARSGIEKPVMKGRGFMLLPDKQTYAAAVSGVVKTDGYELNINKLLVLDDAEKLGATIDFLGSIHVKCNLKAGTLIKAQGDIIFDTVAEALHIESGGEIVFKESAVGMGEGTIKAAGSISSKTLNRCEIHAGGTIFANSVINCQVYTDEKVVCFGDIGTIYGGYIEAKLGTESAIVGSKAGTHTQIRIGITTQMWNELKEAEKKKERLATQIETLAAELSKLSGVKLQNRDQLQWKVKISAAYSVRQTELEEANAAVEEISGHIRSVEGAQALIGQTLYAGTTFVVDDTVMHITETKETETGIVIKGKEKRWHR